MSHERLAAGALDSFRRIVIIVNRREKVARRNTVISVHGKPDWAGEGELRAKRVPFCTTDAHTQIVAVRQGLGITTLPCFVGDADPLMARAPGAELHMYGTLWLLTQGETRNTKRVGLFIEFASLRLAAYAPLLAGLSVSRD